MTLLGLLCALAAFAVGLVVHLRWASGPEGERHDVLAWFLLALVPVILLFTFFPDDNEFSGTFARISTGGAIGAFIFIWYWGTRTARKARVTDNLRAQVRSFEQAAARDQDRPVQDQQLFAYEVVGCPGMRLGIVAGRIDDVHFVDVWVNSENIYMQMSRFFDRTISGRIRYSGAKKNEFGQSVKDTIADELAERVGDRVPVMPGTVVRTSSGELRHTHNVKWILHVAAVQGEVGRGYRQVEDVSQCVDNALRDAGRLGSDDDRPHSILLPLFGAASGRGDVDATARTVVSRATAHFADRPESPITDVWLLGFSVKELEALRAAAQASPKLRALRTAPAPAPLGPAVADG
jgi:hypothetical protein